MPHTVNIIPQDLLDLPPWHLIHIHAASLGSLIRPFTRRRVFLIVFQDKVKLVAVPSNNLAQGNCNDTWKIQSRIRGSNFDCNAENVSPAVHCS